MPCHALMSPLKTVILSLPPRLRVPRWSSCVHRDRRPDPTVSGAHSPRFVFRFSKVFCFVLVCFSRGKEVATRPSALARVKSAWEFGGIAASPLATSPPARRSRGISAAVRGSQPRHSHRAHRSREFMPTSAAHRARRSREMTSLSAAHPRPPDRRWLKPAGSPLTQAHRPPLTLAPWI